MPIITKSKSSLERFREAISELPSPKGGLPSLPTKFSVLENKDISDLLSVYGAWREFASDRHIEALYVHTECKNKYESEFDIQYLAAKAGTATDKKTMARVHPKVHELHKNLVESEQYLSLWAGKLETFKDMHTVISRELERRKIDNM